MISGDGFAQHEFPNLTVFRQNLFLSTVPLALEDVQTGLLVGVFVFGPSSSVRLPAGVVGEGLIMIDIDFQGRNVGKDVAEIGRGIAKDAGYRALLNSYFANNDRSRHLFKVHGWDTVGVLPRAAYLGPVVGWQDMVFTYLDLTQDRIASFSRMADENSRGDGDGSSSGRGGGAGGQSNSSRTKP
jgi:L-amino acid N-acyltransferase YncA